jgi:hypothetical protein
MPVLPPPKKIPQVDMATNSESKEDHRKPGEGGREKHCRQRDELVRRPQDLEVEWESEAGWGHLGPGGLG